MIPIYDDNPIRRIRFAWVNWSIIATTIAIYALFQSGASPVTYYADVSTINISYGLIPVVLFDKMSLPSDLSVIPAWLTILTSLFLHGSWMHLLGNMLFLWVLGDNIEDELGHLPYLIFYLGCGAAGAMAHALSVPDSTSPLIGASTAVSGVVSAYLFLHPKARIWMLLFMRIPLPLPAWAALGGWIILQVFNAFFAPADSDVAWFGHLGGILAGPLLALALGAKPDWRARHIARS